jgi:endonuclease-3
MESTAHKKRRTAKIIGILKKTHADARCALDHSNPLELLVATILSAQCTDQRVNMVTPALFKKYRAAEDFAAAGQAALQREIRSTGLFRNKSAAIRGACRIIADEHAGRVPDTMDELLQLPGVARKTANVVLGNAYDKSEGIVVDTHVARLAGRLGLTAAAKAQAEKIERDLMQLVPRDNWTLLAHLLIFHGRRVCTARRPNCLLCPLNKLCPSAFSA